MAFDLENYLHVRNMSSEQEANWRSHCYQQIGVNTMPLCFQGYYYSMSTYDLSTILHNQFHHEQ